MKTITPALRAHLDGRVTTLATIWRIIRTDGKSFFFTDHDETIVYLGDTYSAKTGYNRTSMSNNVGLSVDELDVEGVFDSADITEVDLRAGLFDYAEIRISLVNWADLSQGELKQRRGRIGEVVITQQGVFRTELRGLVQQLSQSIVEMYQAECRVDLGSAKCSIPLLPPVLSRSQVILPGEIYRVPTGDTTTLTFSELVVNGGFERDTVGDNKTSLVGWEIITSPVNIETSDGGLSAFEGSNFFKCGDGATSEVQQDIFLEDTFGASITAIDAGNFTADFSCQRANNDVDDTARVLVQFLDGDLAPLSVLYDSTLEEITPVDSWVSRSATAIPVPVGTKVIRIRFLGTRVTGTESNSCLDAVTLSMTESATTNSFQEVYENRVYTVETGGNTGVTQPVYDTTIGNITTEDGTAPIGTVDLWAGVSGSVNDITVDSVSIMSGVEAFDTDLATTALNVASNITAFTSTPNYTATAASGLITITADDKSSAPNGFVVLSFATSISRINTNMAGGLDGATLIAGDCFTRHATISEVIDQHNFELVFSDARAVDDWLNGGALIIESGFNAGIVKEIRGWDATSNTVTLFLPLAFEVFSGTKVRVYPGCDKRIATCQSKFSNVINFRGEPYVPGQDELTNYPDAR